MITAELDSSRFTGSMEALLDATGRDAADVLRDESVLLIGQTVKFTPPIAGKKGPPKTSGEMAIKSELSNLFAGITDEFGIEVRQKYGDSNIDGFMEGKDGQPIHLQWGGIVRKEAMPGVHQHARNSKGKVPFQRRGPKGVWKARFAATFDDLAGYIKTVQKRVGRMRASLAVSAGAIKPGAGRFPSWISRHFGAVSTISRSDTAQLQNHEKPSVSFASSAPGITDLRPKVQAALNSRAGHIVTKLSHLVKGYGHDLSQGRHPSPKHSTLPADPQEVIE